MLFPNPFFICSFPIPDAYLPSCRALLAPASSSSGIVSSSGLCRQKFCSLNGSSSFFLLIYLPRKHPFITSTDSLESFFR